MKENTKKKTTTTQKNVNKNQVQDIPTTPQTRQLNRDLRDSVMVVSVFANVFILTAWLVVEVSNRYDAALIGYLLSK